MLYNSKLTGRYRFELLKEMLEDAGSCVRGEEFFPNFDALSLLKPVAKEI